MPTPYDAYTDSSEVVASYILNLLTAAANTFTPAIDSRRGFYYGEQDLLPTSPSICVSPGPETSTYNGTGGRPVMITFQTFVMVYSEIVRDIQLNVHESSQLATAVKHVVHADKNLGGNVLDCYCTSVEPGYAVKKGSLASAVRMTFQSRAKKLLNP